MEAVAAHARVLELAGQREHLLDAREGPVHGGVEARHLRQLRRARQHRADRGEVVGQVQRRDRNQLLHLGEEDRVHAGGHHVPGRAVGDAVTDRDQAVGAAAALPEPAGDVGERAVVTERLAGRPALLARRMAGRVLGHEARRAADALDLTAGDQRQRPRPAARTPRT